MTKKQARDLRAGDRMQARILTNPDNDDDRVVVYDEVILIEPLDEAYRVYVGDDTVVLEGGDTVEVKD